MYEGDNKIIDVSVENEMEKSYLAYSMSVIVGRALPDVRDGLKPVHRRILYTLFENGLSPDKAYRKSADTVGSVLGSYHPHGDASVYDALVRMAQDFSLRYTLVDGHGNFGSVDGDPPAAYRYTEAKLSKISMHMLTDIEKETVPFQPNYDDRLKEPVVLPSRFPNILVNGATGIAVGMATNIPPHNLGEVIDGICYLIENPDAEISQIMQFVLGPDFPTGGIIMGTSGIRAAYYTGRGKIILRSKTEIEELKNGKSRIIVTEIPYMVNKSRLLESIADLVKEKRIEGISDLHDESDRDGMRIVIEVKRDANAQIVLNQLFKLTQLQDTVGVIMLALADGMPKVLNLKEIMEHYIKFQEEVITNRTRFELKKAKERAHILEGLKIAIDNIDEVIKTIKQASSIAEAKEHLQARFGLTEIQAAAIVAMRLGQLTGLEREKIENELAELKLRIAELISILENKDLILKIIKDELQQIKAKFNDKRRTQIESVYGEVDIEDLIEEHDCVVTLTRDGYIKRQPVNNYKAQKRGGKGIIGLAKKEEDFISELFVCSSHDHIFFFTNRGKAYRLKCYQIPEGGRNSKGTNIINLIEIEKDEGVTAVLKVKNLQTNEYLVMLTKHGVVKRTQLSEFLNIRRTGLIAINLDKDDELGWVALTNGECKVFIATKNGKALYFKESDVRCVSRASRGSRGISLNADDVVVGMVAVESPEQKIITITEKGIGRCTKLSEYRLKFRGQKGILNYKISKKTGGVVSAKAVSDNDDVMLIKNDGTIIRVAVKDINVMISRATIGVHLMRVKEDEHVVAIARAPHEDEENTQETEDNKKVD